MIFSILNHNITRWNFIKTLTILRQSSFFVFFSRRKTFYVCIVIIGTHIKNLQG